ncbi:MAG TPA: M20/M25/M40 family metallo-hydrolase [Spirochaetia bacterium]|nr:M20/M25/M40 family metallo-hydrolase [Spirochaetia bacterium]
MLFYAHYDVVPASGDAGWTHPPFSGDIADGFVWGRGTLDDKSCLLAIMEAVESLLTEGFQPQGTVYIAFGGDEELGSSACAAASVARVLSERGIRLSCVLDEGSVIADGVPLLASRPIAMFGLAEKGSANLEIVVRGSTGHAAMPGKGTAAGALCRVVAAIERHRFPTRLTPTVARFFASLAPHAKGPRKTALRLLRLLWPVLRGPLSKNSTLDAFLRTTQAVTMLRAGEKENVVPDEARAVVNLRLLPGDTSAFALARIERVARKSIPNGFLLKVNFAEGGKPGEAIPESRLQGELWSALRDSLAQVAPDAVVAPCLVVASTDSRQFAGSADAIVRFLPIALTARDVARMHGVDERISLENYGRMIAFYENFVRRIAARQWPIRSGASCSVGMEGV